MCHYPSHTLPSVISGCSHAIFGDGSQSASSAEWKSFMTLSWAKLTWENSLGFVGYQVTDSGLAAASILLWRLISVQRNTV